MDAASILVLILTAGVVALLVWFEVNSRRNDARSRTSTPVETNPDALHREEPGRQSGKEKAA
jgi:hypothetical protein